MSRKDPKFPWRVIALSSLLFAALAFGAWLAFAPSGNGDPAGAGEPTSASGLSPDDATPAPSASASGGEPQTANGSEPAPIDPSTPEGRAALAAARAGAGTMDLQLFLIVPGSERLIPFLRTVSAPSTLDAQVERAVQELIDWSSPDAISPVAPEAHVREVWVSPGGIAYIDFDRAFYDFSGGGSLGELHTVYGIVATLTESFPEIVAVQFLIEGSWVETLAGHVDLSMPLLPSSEWVVIEPREGQIQQSDDPL